MYSIDEIREVNKNYDDAADKLRVLNEKVREINDNICLEDVNVKLNYTESKELYKLILSRSNDKKRCEVLKEIVDNKKIEEYPMINDVHYYPIINEIDFITREDKIKLDKLLKNAYKNITFREDIKNLDSQIINFLVTNSVIEQSYIFHCNCNSFECDDKVIEQERFDDLKDYWNKKGSTTHEEDRMMNYGCFETGCWNDGSVEICSLDDFNEHLRRTFYKVIIAPDMTLDNI